MRIILGVIIGFLAWPIMWVGAERLMSMLSPGWFGPHQTAFEDAVINGGAYWVPTSILVFNLFRGLITTVITGYVTAAVAGENRIAPLIVGVLLLVFDIYVVWASWEMVQLWYHVLFTLMLIPMTVFGARLRARAVP